MCADVDSPSRKNWLVTGCSSGIGRLLVDQLITEHQNVVATARRPSELPNHWVYVLPLDVRKPIQIRASIQEAIRLLGHIDVFVNNAGIGYLSTVEEADFPAVEALFETNVYGPACCMQAILPHFRERNSGTLITIGSVLGRCGIPRSGFSCASKAALACIVEAAAYELSHTNIRFALLEPGLHKTGYRANQIRNLKLQDHRSPYYQEIPRWLSAVEQLMPNWADPLHIVDVIIALGLDCEHFERHCIGEDADRVARLQAIGRLHQSLDARIAAGRMTPSR